jgi:phosphate-selective porin OprO/OprP
MRRYLVNCLPLALLAFPAAPVEAGPSIDERIDELQRAVDAQRAQLDTQQQLIETQAVELARLRERLSSGDGGLDPNTRIEIAELKREVQTAKLAAQDAPRVGVVAGRPTIATADGRSSVSLRTVVQLDIARHNQDSEGPLTSDFRRGSQGLATLRETNGARDLSNGAYFRRARLGFEGMISEDFGFRFMGEFGGSGTEGPTRINDAWINYTGFAPFTFQLGAFTPSANLDDATSQEELLFPERSTPAELSRTLGGADGRIGFAVRGSGQRWMNSLALTTRTAGDPEVFDAQRALVGRGGILALTSDDHNVHVGASGTWVLDAADLGSSATPPRFGMRLRDRPELRVDSTRLIDTGPIDAEHAYAAGLEFAGNWRNFYLQGENFWYGFDRREAAGLDDPRFGAFYVQGSWILTGERRRYNMSSGSFQLPRPFVPFSLPSGFGAWELALRYSHTDLDYHAGSDGTAAALDAVRGGVQDVWTLGLNWYLNSNLRMSLNYYRVEVDRLNPAGPGNPTPFGPAPSTPPIGVEIGQDYDVVGIRTQFNF